MIDSFGSEIKKRTGSRVFFAADEFYLKAGREIPNADYYEDYPQIENGVGMLRSFADEFSVGCDDIADLVSGLASSRTVLVATGVASYPMILSLAEKIESLSGGAVKINVYCIINRFFGESITVSGLLTGKDISEQLSGKLCCDELIIPAVATRREELDFLCGMTLSELSERLSVRIRLSGNSGFDFVDAVFGIDCE